MVSVTEMVKQIERLNYNRVFKEIQDIQHAQNQKLYAGELAKDSLYRQVNVAVEKNDSASLRELSAKITEMWIKKL
jgi:hypothetical protein